jgi:membrane associated rhomboid family serine protease
VIPLRDANPTAHRPWVTYALVGLNVLAFLAWQPTFGTPLDQAIFFHCHGAIPAELFSLEPLGEVAAACGGKSVPGSILTSMFLHGGWLHLGGNMLYLWIFGNNVEDRMRPVMFLGFYLLGGIVAAYAQALTSPGSDIPLIGASGAIAAVLGAYLVMHPHARVQTLVIFYFITVIELPAVAVLVLWFVLQALQGVGSLGGDVAGVAWFAHIGGFVFGAAVAFLFYRPRPAPHPVSPWER